MQQRGFTLIELMIVVGIIGLIVTLAYPSYQGVIKAGSRSAAQADLMALAAALERHKAANFSYAGAAAGGANTGKPAIFADYSPASENASSKKYDLRITTVTASGNGYQIMAEPVSGTSSAGDGKVMLFSDGRKAWDKNNDGTLQSSEYCWSC